MQPFADRQRRWPPDVAWRWIRRIWGWTRKAGPQVTIRARARDRASAAVVGSECDTGVKWRHDFRPSIRAAARRLPGFGL